ncbi:MAG TPA: redoxin domain-containing protein [Thermoanaerobaculia bacterium]
MRTKALVVALILLTASVALAEDRAVCAVCGPREGSGFEPVRATATYKGKQYFFCSLECKVEFLKNPQAFLVTDAGKPAPSFTLPTFEGGKVSLADFRGEVVLLDFWATYCVPCIDALPELQALHAKNASRGFTIVGISVDDRAPLVKKATSAAKITYPIVKATPEVWNAYKVNALPALILVGRDGTIIRRYGGEADKTAMLAEIERAIAAQ